LEELDGLLDDHLRDERPKFRIGLPAERHDLADQIPRPLRCQQNLLQVLAGFRRVAHGPESKIAVSEAAAEEIVEVMGDPARERADGLYLLRLRKPLFDP